MIESGDDNKESINEIIAQLVFKCNECNIQFDKKRSLDSHLRTHTIEKLLDCPHCNASFKSKIQYKNHLNIHSGSKPHKCPACELSFTTKGELMRHSKYKHTLEKPHKCDICDYATVELTKLKRHIRTHTGERPYLCPQCDYASCDTFKLKRHMRTHTGEKPYQCPICECRFNQSGTLKNHLQLHKDQQKVFKCEYCPLEFLKISAYQKHKTEKHPNGEANVTKVLDEVKETIEIPIEKIQESINEQVWIKCDHCEMSFSTKEAIDNHMLLHTGERPFECESCGIKFAQKFALRAHMNSHMNPIKREKTPKRKRNKQTLNDKSIFSNEENMSDVIKQDQQNEQTKLSCLLCSESFNIKEELERHMNEDHSIMKQPEMEIVPSRRGRKKKVYDPINEGTTTTTRSIKRQKLEAI